MQSALVTQQHTATMENSSEEMGTVMYVFMKLREVTLLEAVTTAIVKKPERISALGRTEGGLFSFFSPSFILMNGCISSMDQLVKWP